MGLDLKLGGIYNFADTFSFIGVSFFKDTLIKLTKHLKYSKLNFFTWKSKIKCFLSYFNSQTIISLSLSLRLYNEINTWQSFCSLFINYWHKTPVSVNLSWYFIKIHLNISEWLKRLLEWMQKYLWLGT